MALRYHLALLLTLFLFVVFATANTAEAQLVDDSTSFELPTSFSYGGIAADEEEAAGDLLDSRDEGEEEEEEEGSQRRALLWRMHYYISYGALSANRIPCPARSGRSYYTHNCYRARGRANPYHRGCSVITRCRR